MSQPGDRLVSPQEAAELFKTSIGYVYKMASVHKWRRVRHSGRIYYDLLEVAEHLGK